MALLTRTLTKAGLLGGVAVGLLMGPAPISPARAADTTPAQASSLEAQVRDALSGLLGPAIKLNDRIVQITPAGDHFDVLVPLKGVLPAAPGAAPGDMQVTATAKQGESGIWLIENIRATSPLRFTMQMPVPPKAGQPAGKGTTVPVTQVIEQTGQDGRIVWDPSFATPSTWTTVSRSTTAHSEGGPIPTSTSVGPVNALTTLRPAGADRVDVLLDGTLQDYKLETQGDAPMQIGIQRVRVGMAMNGVSRARGVTLIQALTTVVAGALQAPSPADAKPPAPEVIRAMLGALQDFASDFTLDETFDGFIVKTQGQTVAMDQMKLGLDAKSDAGLLRAGLTLGMQGLALPDLPLGEMAVLVPRRVVLHPVVGNVSVADLSKLATAATEKRDPTPAEIAALFSHGGITAGVESLIIEVAGATLTGQGKLVATEADPKAISGTAQLTIENFDGLMQKVTAIPSLAQQAVPVMVFVKGIGRVVDNKLVYDIVYKDSKVLINNVDLTAMAGGGGGAAPAPAPRPPAARPAIPSPGPAQGAPKGPAPRSAPGQVPSWAK